MNDKICRHKYLTHLTALFTAITHTIETFSVVTCNMLKYSQNNISRKTKKQI